MRLLSVSARPLCFFNTKYDDHCKFSSRLNFFMFVFRPTVAFPLGLLVLVATEDTHSPGSVSLERLIAT